MDPRPTFPRPSREFTGARYLGLDAGLDGACLPEARPSSCTPGAPDETAAWRIAGPRLWPTFRTGSTIVAQVAKRALDGSAWRSCYLMLGGPGGQRK